MRALVRAITGLWGLLVGLFITGRFIFCRKKTVYYPRQVIEPDRLLDFRGPVELIGTEADPAVPRCISCMLCMNNCPSGCIRIEKRKAPEPTALELEAMREAEARGEKPKKPPAPKDPALWDYDFTKCSLCGICVEVCPVKSLRFSNDIYLAGTSRLDFHFDLLARLKRLAQAAAPAHPARPAGPAGLTGSADPVNQVNLADTAGIIRPGAASPPSAAKGERP